MKINAIKTPVVRKVMSTAMLAAATLGVTNVMAKPSKAQEAMPTQTEVMSPEAAKAAQAYTTSGKTLSYQRNNKLDAKMLAAARNEEERAKNKVDLDHLYSKYGTFFTSLLVQHSLDVGLMKEFLDGTDKMIGIYSGILSAFGVSNCDTAALERAEALAKGIENLYEAGMAQNMNSLISGGDFSAERVSAYLDEIVETNTWTDKEYYKTLSEYYRGEQKDKYSAQGWSDWISYKMFMIDNMYISSAIRQCNLSDLFFTTFKFKLDEHYKPIEADATNVYMEVFMNKVFPSSD